MDLSAGPSRLTKRDDLFLSRRIVSFGLALEQLTQALQLFGGQALDPLLGGQALEPFLGRHGRHQVAHSLLQFRVAAEVLHGNPFPIRRNWVICWATYTTMLLYPPCRSVS